MDCFTSAFRKLMLSFACATDSVKRPFLSAKTAVSPRSSLLAAWDVLPEETLLEKRPKRRGVAVFAAGLK